MHSLNLMEYRWNEIFIQSWKQKFWGGTRVWTGDLSICSRMLYHWAIPPVNWTMQYIIYFQKQYFKNLVPEIMLIKIY